MDRQGEVWAREPVTAPSSEEAPGRSGTRRGTAPGGVAAGGSEADGAGAGSGVSGATRGRAERRLSRMREGARELEHRLADLVDSGLASARGPGAPLWQETAARMVDAQAPGLAARVREVGALPGSGTAWPSRLLEECALLHLLDEGILGLERLPTALAATVRARAGLTTEAAEVLRGPDAAPLRDRWLVLARRDDLDERVASRRVWLRGLRTGRMALHLAFSGPGRPFTLGFAPGVVVDAELGYYPGAAPLRVAWGATHGDPAPGGVPEGVGVDGALAAYGGALRDDPWCDAWPVILSEVVPAPAARGGTGWQIADADGESALPVDGGTGYGTGLWQLLSVSGGAPVTVFGECGHRGFRPLTTWAPDPVPL